MKTEIWLPVEGYENYEVSSEGRVRSLNYNKTGEIRVLSPIKTKSYFRINLWKEGKQKIFLIHRLVATTFIPNPNNLSYINHRDENPENNRVENLEWCTPKYNINYGTRNKRVSEKMTNGKLSKIVLQFSKDGEFIREWPSAMEVQRVLGFNRAHISQCCLGKLKSAYNYIWRYKTDLKFQVHIS